VIKSVSSGQDTITFSRRVNLDNESEVSLFGGRLVKRLEVRCRSQGDLNGLLIWSEELSTAETFTSQ
jgi:hypothetical protein